MCICLIIASKPTKQKPDRIKGDIDKSRHSREFHTSLSVTERIRQKCKYARSEGHCPTTLRVTKLIFTDAQQL